MKKIFYLFLGVLLFIPACIYADMGSPIINEYEASVYNSNGAFIYEDKDESKKTNLKVAPGQKFVINFESEYIYVSYIDEGGEFVKVVDSGGINADASSGYISIYDLRAIKDSYKFVDKEWEKATDVLVIKDQEIRVGTGYAYSSTGKIIKGGTTIKARANTYAANPWYYVEYEGTKGYISSFDGRIGFEPKLTTLFTTAKTEVKDSTGKTIDTIESNIQKDVKLYSIDEWSMKYYIEYDGKKGFVDYDTIVLKQDKIEFSIINDVNVYKSFDCKVAGDCQYEKVGVVKKDTKFNSEYYFTSDKYSITVYYENGNVKGWLKCSFEQVSDSNGIINGYLLDVSYDEQDEDISNPELIEVDDDLISPKKDNQTMIICIIAGVVLFICAIVTIMLINKKKIK